MNDGFCEDFNSYGASLKGKRCTGSGAADSAPIDDGFMNTFLGDVQSC